MRTLYKVGVALAGLTALALPVRAQSLKIAYLDSGRILAEAPGSDAVRTAIQQEVNRFQARIKAMSDSIDVMVADYQRQSVLLSPDEKKKREDAIRQRQQSMEQRAQFLQDEAQTKQTELMDPVMKKVEVVIEALRKEGGYAIIFDSASRSMVSADSALDLTNQVLSRLKAQASASPAKN